MALTGGPSEDGRPHGRPGVTTPRGQARLRSALIAAGVIALGVCLLAALDLGWRGRWRTASLFLLPWAVFAVLLVAPRRGFR